MDECEHQVVMTLGNADTAGNVFRNRLADYANRNSDRIFVFNNLGQLRYLSAMKHCHFLIGNSSSGIIEAASLNTPVVNIGNRQKGRACSENVVHCDSDSKSIIEGFIKAE